MIKIEILVNYLDELLNIKGLEDSSLNGLQVSNSGQITKVAYSVDSSLSIFKKAKEFKADFLFVHHGIFWGKPFPITGTAYERIKLLIDNNLALYAAHLPLDIHSKFGNNSMIEKLMDWPVEDNFGMYKGNLIGKKFHLKKEKTIDDIDKELGDKLGTKPIVWHFGTDKIKRIAYVSGDAINMLNEAINDEVDLFITGEPAHSAFWTAKEAKINVIFAGHYATETIGVKAVGKEIKEKFDINTVFIDLPTGY